MKQMHRCVARAAESGISLSELKRRSKAIARAFFGIALPRATLFPIIANVRRGEGGMFNNCTRRIDGRVARNEERALLRGYEESDERKLN